MGGIPPYQGFWVPPPGQFFSLRMIFSFLKLQIRKLSLVRWIMLISQWNINVSLAFILSLWYPHLPQTDWLTLSSHSGSVSHPTEVQIMSNQYVCLNYLECPPASSPMSHWPVQTDVWVTSVISGNIWRTHPTSSHCPASCRTGWCPSLW